MSTSKPKDIDDYISRFPIDTQEILEQIRVTIKKVIPEAEETISYGIPTFNLNGTYLIYFAAYKNHIGVYPVPETINQVDKEFASYNTSGKGTIQFPLNKPMPLNLITKIVKFKVTENVERVEKKKQTKILPVSPEIHAYNDRQNPADKEICDLLSTIIDSEMSEAECKIWHAHPVWFINGNPIVGYSKQKAGLRLMFWSGAGFEEEKLNVTGKKFKDASVFYTTVGQISSIELKRWIKKSKEIQWDYKNIVKRKGRLDRLK